METCALALEYRQPPSRAARAQGRKAGAAGGRLRDPVWGPRPQPAYPPDLRRELTGPTAVPSLLQGKDKDAPSPLPSIRVLRAARHAAVPVSAPSQVLAGVLPEEQVSHAAAGRHRPLSGCQERGPGAPWQNPNLPVSSQAVLVSFKNDLICRNGC